MARRSSRAAFALCAFLAAPETLIAQGVPLGPEFRVNTYTTSYQVYPAVASDSGGNFVVTWASNGEDGSLGGVFAQRYSSAGAPLGGEFRVNTYTTSTQSRPAVASDSAGNFVIVWQGALQDGGGSYGIFAQRYESTGFPLGTEFRVNTYTTGEQQQPCIASDAAGNFVVAWEGDYPGGSGWEIHAQRFASTGAPLGGEFVVNDVPNGDQRYPSVASGSAGNFVVAWMSNGGPNPGFDVVARRFAGSGVPLGTEFEVNTYTTSYQTRPSVASDAAGNFVVVWQSYLQDGSAEGIFAQRVASTGAPLGGEFRVNSYTSSFQSYMSVAADPGGNFIVAWTGQNQDGSGSGVFGQRYGSTGAPLGGEFRVNAYTTGYQGIPAVASDGAGNFVVVWAGTGSQDDIGVFGQRYSPILPVELQSFRVE